MSPSVTIRCVAGILAGLVLDFGIAAQTSPDVTQPSARRRLEDQLARLFESIRAKQGLPPLARIGHRQSLEELVCSAASLDASAWRYNSPAALMYRTSDPAAANQHLEQIAGYQDVLQAKGAPRVTRYAVAVWPLSNQGPDRPTYWVGVQVYESAWWEFIDNNFTTKIVVSGGYLTNGLLSQCGLYELTFATGEVRQIASNSDCKYSSSWNRISLSPDGRRIVAVRRNRLELIDTQTKAIQSLGLGFYHAAWSPDGRWIAALGDHGDATLIIDALTLTKRKTLPPTEVIWSPTPTPSWLPTLDCIVIPISAL